MPHPTDTSRGYDRIADQIRMSDTFYLRCLEVAGPMNGDLLDVGCGQGGLLQHARRHAPKLRVFGCDVSQELCRRARESLGCPVVKADAARLPFENHRFDWVTMTEVLEHLTDPVGVLRDVRRLLRHEGKLLLTVPNRDWPRYPRYQKTRRAYQPIDDQWYRVDEVTGFLTRAGFRVLTLDGFGSIFGGGLLKGMFERVLLTVSRSLRQRQKRLLVVAERAPDPPS